jgi:hypothetical protein
MRDHISIESLLSVGSHDVVRSVVIRLQRVCQWLSYLKGIFGILLSGGCPVASGKNC